MKFTDEQKQAIEKDNTNIIVSAGAGSGKTAVLSERVINKVNKGVNINELLILTFTKNAATEMKDRIRKKLKINNKLEQLKYIDSAYITTFDAFVFSIVKKYSHVIGIDSDIKIVDSTVINFKKKEIIDNILEKLINDDNKVIKTYLANKTTKNSNLFKDLILELDNKTNLIVKKDQYLNNYIENYYSNDNINKLYANYKEYIENIRKDFIYYSNMIKNLDPEYYSSILPDISHIIENTDGNYSVSTLKQSPRNSSDEFKYYKNILNSIYKQLKDISAKNKDILVNEVKCDKDLVNIVINILLELNSEINIFKQKYNSYEYIDITRFAIDLLEDDSNILLELKNSFNEIMVDEYQDNNNIQEYLINLISENNVYTVGDIKQSIYLFRNANPNIFKTKYEKYKGEKEGIKIDLNKNFRSRKEVLESINIVFNNIMSLSIGDADYVNDHQMIFGLENYEKHKMQDENYSLEIYNYLYNKVNKSDEIEAFIIADDIRKKINNKYQIYDTDQNKLRNIEYSDFSVIMDRYSVFNTFEKAFDYYQIPFISEKDDNILIEEELLIIKNIISLIINIRDNKMNKSSYYNFTSIARSYLFAYDDDYIFNVNKNKEIKNTVIYDKCFNISKKFTSLDNKSLLQLIIDEFDFYEKIITVNNINYKFLVLKEVLNKFRDLNNFGYDIYDINYFIDDLIKDGKSEMKVNIKNTSKSSVSLTSIHKSKGLEYPICYYPIFNKNFNFRDSSSHIIFDENFGLVTNLEQDNKNFVYTLYKDQYRKKQVSEKVRLLYVAMTRAREKMIIVTDLNEESYEDSSSYSKLNHKSFNDFLLSIKSNINTYIKNVDIPYINENYKVMKTKRFKPVKDTAINVDEKHFEKKLVTKDSFSKKQNLIFNEKQIRNIEFGNKIHFILENIDLKNPNFTNINDQEQLIIKNLLENNVMKNINEAKIFKEFEFISSDNNNVKIGIIDLMLEYEEHIDIIDYKLQNIDDSAYIEQLKGYKDYISTITDKKVNTYLYSIIDNKFKIIY